MAVTALDIVNQVKDTTVKLNELTLIKENKGKYNFMFKLNGKEFFLNYVTMEELNAAEVDEDGKDRIIHIKYGKKDPSWKSDYWYVV